MKVLLQLLAITIAISLSGCSGGAKPAHPAGDGTSPSSPTSSRNISVPVAPPAPEPAIFEWASTTLKGDVAMELTFTVPSATECIFTAAARGKASGSGLQMWLSRTNASGESFIGAQETGDEMQVHNGTVDSRKTVPRPSSEGWVGYVLDADHVQKNVTYLFAAFGVDPEGGPSVGSSDPTQGAALRIKMACGPPVKLTKASVGRSAVGFGASSGAQGGAGASVAMTGDQASASRDDRIAKDFAEPRVLFRAVSTGSVDNGTLSLSYPGGHRTWILDSVPTDAASAYLRYDGAKGAYALDLDRVSVQGSLAGVLVGLLEAKSLEAALS